MKLIFNVRLVGILLMAGFVSCKKQVPAELTLIPNTATFVAVVNAGQVKDKLISSRASIEKIISNLSNNNDSALKMGKNEWENLKSSGLDLEKNVYAWVQSKGATSGNSSMGNNISAILANVKNTTQLADYISKKDASLVIKKDKNFTYAAGNNNKLIAWNDKWVIAMFYNSTSTAGMGYDSLSGEFNLKPPVSDSSTNDLMAEMTACFTRTESTSMASVKSFSELEATKADIALWANPASSIDGIPFPLPKIKELAEGNYSAFTLNFEDGKIVVDSKSFTGKALTGILQKYKGPTVDLELIKRFPSTDINGFMVFAFDPQLFSGIVKYMEVGAIVDNYITNFMGTTYTLDQLLKAFKGDIAVIVSNIGMQQPAIKDSTAMPTMPLPQAKMIFTMPAGDKKEMNKIMERLVYMKLVEKTSRGYEMKGPFAFGLTGLADDQGITIASDEQLLQAYKLNKPMAQAIDLKPYEGKSAASYFNIASVLNNINIQQGDTSINSMISQAKATFKDIHAYSNNFNGSAIESHFELRFVNEKENSLVSLLSFVANISEAAKKDNQVIASLKN